MSLSAKAGAAIFVLPSATIALSFARLKIITGFSTSLANLAADAVVYV